jgi:hypothetical protein
MTFSVNCTLFTKVLRNTILIKPRQSAALLQTSLRLERAFIGHDGERRRNRALLRLGGAAAARNQRPGPR